MEKTVQKVIHYKAGYEVRHELVNGKEFGTIDTLIKSAYTSDGLYIGDPKMAHWLVAKRGIKPELRTETSQTCSIGFSEQQQKWFGWSHRGICGFGIGDKLFDAEWGTESTLFIAHGAVTIETMDQARQAAMNFAEYVR